MIAIRKCSDCNGVGRVETIVCGPCDRGGDCGGRGVCNPQREEAKMIECVTCGGGRTQYQCAAPACEAWVGDVKTYCDEHEDGA